MIDLHLINLALAGLGIGAGAVVLFAVAIVAIAALSQHVTVLRHGTPVIPIPSRAQGTPAEAGLARRAA